MNHNFTLNADNTSIQTVAFSGRYISVQEASGEFEIKIPSESGFIVDIADEIDLGSNFDAGIKVQLVNRSGNENKIKLADSPVPVIRKKKVSLDVDSLPVSLAADAEVRVSNLADIPAPVVNVDAPVVNVDAPIVNVPAPVVNVSVGGANALSYTISTLSWVLQGGEVKIVPLGSATRVKVVSATNYIELGLVRLPFKKSFDLDGLAVDQELTFTNKSGGTGRLDMLLYTPVVDMPVLELIGGANVDLQAGDIYNEQSVVNAGSYANLEIVYEKLNGEVWEAQAVIDTKISAEWRVKYSADGVADAVRAVVTHGRDKYKVTVTVKNTHGEFLPNKLFYVGVEGWNGRSEATTGADSKVELDLRSNTQYYLYFDDTNVERGEALVFVGASEYELIEPVEYVSREITLNYAGNQLPAEGVEIVLIPANNSVFVGELGRLTDAAGKVIFEVEKGGSFLFRVDGLNNDLVLPTDADGNINLIVPAPPANYGVRPSGSDLAPILGDELRDLPSVDLGGEYIVPGGELTQLVGQYWSFVGDGGLNEPFYYRFTLAIGVYFVSKEFPNSGMSHESPVGVEWVGE